ncbi:chromosome segregation in meiosis protein 3 [Aspergillus heteromorphus CBS 117.55]|uniref:Chromosome segregation in meiosis protein n=1 Tax=Aspergillus heteromorphus CBS 117.55 TaxID=1448321 RepID=A0A317UXD4_9EURO|nr:chromosome segregation in meiosis protein 3 [Aspergillus heteromorphus CBS 117.55]PWY66405.1 chromosome segregation in meiosis protein 3 [Aspergillus heteromorphus CBS 117.55]
MENNNISQTNPPPDPDDILFDYDAGLDRSLRESTVDWKKSEVSSTPILGVDEKVKITRRRYTVKLDESRLLSHSGIPKLRLTAKHKLGLKGKGHEFSDAARLLNFYQLWLDDLFPRAKFADGLAIIEKLGHSKHFQTMRREWIEEEKPRRPTGESEDTLKMRLSSQCAFGGVGIPNEHYNNIDTVLFQGDNTMQPPLGSDPGQSRSFTKEGVSIENLSFTNEPPIQPQMIHESIPNDDDDELDALLKEHEGGSDMSARPSLKNSVNG